MSARLWIRELTLQTHWWRRPGPSPEGGPGCRTPSPHLSPPRRSRSRPPLYSRSRRLQVMPTSPALLPPAPLTLLAGAVSGPAASPVFSALHTGFSFPPAVSRAAVSAALQSLGTECTSHWSTTAALGDGRTPPGLVDACHPHRGSSGVLQEQNLPTIKRPGDRAQWGESRFPR